MGMTSSQCAGCGDEITNTYVKKAPKWMARATVVQPDGTVLTGLHDGYSHLENPDGTIVGDPTTWRLDGSPNTTWHADCHLAAALDGKDVSYAGPTPRAVNQGYWVSYPARTHPSPMTGRAVAA